MTHVLGVDGAWFGLLFDFGGGCSMVPNSLSGELGVHIRGPLIRVPCHSPETHGPRILGQGVPR